MCSGSLKTAANASEGTSYACRCLLLPLAITRTNGYTLLEYSSFFSDRDASATRFEPGTLTLTMYM